MKRNSTVKQAALSAAFMAAFVSAATAKDAFAWKNINSSIYGVTANEDDNLQDPWGVVPGEEGHTIWVANELTGTVTRYDLDGNPVQINTGTKKVPALANEVVTIPPATAGGTGSPTGLVFNHAAFGTDPTSEFILPGTQDPSHWLAVTEDGLVVGFNLNADPASATPTAIVGTTVSGAVFTGCALAFTGLSAANEAHRLFAADFAGGKIDVFNSDFSQATLASGAFVDPTATANPGFKPYNVKRYATKDRLITKDPKGKAVSRVILVSYAKNDGTNHATIGAGNGYINVFTTDGSYLGQLVAPSSDATSIADHTSIDTPWGMAILRKNARQADDLLVVANHGDGVLLTYSLAGVFTVGGFTAAPHPDGILERGDDQRALRFDDLRAIHFGQKAESVKVYAADEDETDDGDGALYFSADIAANLRGLLGHIFPAQ